MKKRVEKRGKTANFDQKKCENGCSVGNLYFNSNGGMRVGGVLFRKCLLFLPKNAKLK
ncbi:hypothetical protein U8M33_17310 [Virgibacillus pantothenticus]|nr:hypothetical protein [Virgibacillus pantothenticus]